LNSNSITDNGLVDLKI